MPEVELHTAIAKAEAGDWIDPVDEPIHWYAELCERRAISKELLARKSFMADWEATGGGGASENNHRGPFRGAAALSRS
jgi:hypothetical protein